MVVNSMHYEREKRRGKEMGIKEMSMWTTFRVYIGQISNR